MYSMGLEGNLYSLIEVILFAWPIERLVILFANG